MVKAALVNLLQCATARLLIEASAKPEAYFGTIEPDSGDEPGTVRKLMRQIMSGANGNGILIQNKGKIYNVKEFQDTSDMGEEEDYEM